MPKIPSIKLLEYEPKPADIILWKINRKSNILALGSSLPWRIIKNLFGYRYIHSSIIQPVKIINDAVILEQNLDVVSETPYSLKQVFKKYPGYELDVYRVDNISEHEKRNVIKTMRDYIIPLKYSKIDAFSLLFKRKKDTRKIIDFSFSTKDVCLYFTDENKEYIHVESREEVTCAAAIALAFTVLLEDITYRFQLVPNKSPWYIVPDDIAKSPKTRFIGTVDENTVLL